MGGLVTAVGLKRETRVAVSAGRVERAVDLVAVESLAVARAATATWAEGVKEVAAREAVRAAGPTGVATVVVVRVVATVEETAAAAKAAASGSYWEGRAAVMEKLGAVLVVVKAAVVMVAALVEGRVEAREVEVGEDVVGRAEEMAAAAVDLVAREEVLVGALATAG